MKREERYAGKPIASLCSVPRSCAGFALLFALSLHAQTGSIAGTVRDGASGQPVPAAVLSDGQSSVQADENGHYTFSGSGPGQVTIRVLSTPQNRPNPGNASRTLTVYPGQFLNGVDIVIPAWGSLSGRTVDGGKTPVAGLTLELLRKEYRAGVIQYISTGVTVNTDERGGFQIGQIEPGPSFVLLLYPRRASNPAQDVAVDPKKRTPEIPRTYFPGTTDPDSAESLVLKPGEVRSGLEIQISPTATYCVGGTIEGTGHPPTYSYSVGREDSDGSLVRAPSNGSAGADSKFLVCHLASGTYRVSAVAPATAAIESQSGMVRVSIHGGDVRDLRLPIHVVAPVTFTWDWDGQQPAPPDPLPVGAGLTSLQPGASSSFGISGSGRTASRQVPLADYAVQVQGLPIGYYVKEAEIGTGHSLRHPVLDWMSILAGGSIRFRIARDGANITASVAGPDGTMVPSATVVVLPENVTSPAELSAVMVFAKPDQTGQFYSPTLAPGKYQVLATHSPIYFTPECMTKIWALRSSATEVEISPNGSGSVKLTLTKIE